MGSKDKKDKKPKSRESKTKGTQHTEEDGPAHPAKTNEKAKITAFPINKVNKELQKANKGHVHSELDSRPQFNLFGANLPMIEGSFAKEIKSVKLEISFNRGDIIKSATCSYEVQMKLNSEQDIYKVHQVGIKEEYWLKLEPSITHKRGPRLSHEVNLMKNSRKTRKQFRSHFLKMIDRCKVDTRYNFLVTQMAGPSLVDVKAKLKGQFLPNDAVRLCMQTLQAVHDVHLCHNVHRDIQPKNFAVGHSNASIVYLVDFNFCFEYYPNKKGKMCILPKYKLLSKMFQSRNFHAGVEYKRLDDMESWIYLCYWLFDSKCLPWEDLLEGKDVTSERRICNRKERFLMGMNDKEMAEKTDRYLPTALPAMRNKIYGASEASDSGPINYALFGETVLYMREEIHVEWSEPFQWQTSEPTETSVAKYIKHSHDAGSFCVTCENSPLAKKTYECAPKSEKQKSESRLTVTKTAEEKKAEEDDSESSSSSSSDS